MTAFTARPRLGQRQPSLRSISEDEELSFELMSDLSSELFPPPPPPRATKSVLDMVNDARRDAAAGGRTLKPIVRVEELDRLARKHAKSMMKRNFIFHSQSSLAALQQKLESEIVAENVLRGATLGAIYDDILHGQQVMSKRNILHHAFDEMGYAAIRDRKTGTVYLCQLFRKFDAAAQELKKKSSSEQPVMDIARRMNGMEVNSSAATAA